MIPGCAKISVWGRGKDGALERFGSRIVPIDDCDIIPADSIGVPTPKGGRRLFALMPPEVKFEGIPGRTRIDHVHVQAPGFMEVMIPMPPDAAKDGTVRVGVKR